MTKRPRKPTSQPLLNEENVPLQSRPVRKRDPKQPHLPFDPMPDRVEPCLAVLKPRPPRGPQWSYEIKWDGYRLEVRNEPDRVRIVTRGGYDWTSRFPAIAEAVRALGPATMILDGEAVVFDEQGRSDFGLLQKSLGGENGKLPSRNATLMAFDLTYFDGHDLRGVELEARRRMLENLLEGATGAIRCSEDFDEDPDDLLRHACQLGLEGIIAKRRDRRYRPGKTGDWVKSKCVFRDGFAIVGYEPSTAVPGGLARLLLAAMRGATYVYVGGVGTGFSHDQSRSIRKRLDRMKAQVPAVSLRRKNAVFTAPELIAEIEYRGWTHDGKLRHASFKGLRNGEDDPYVLQLVG